MPLLTEQLVVLNQQGLIPGPAEDEATFLRRVALCQERASKELPEEFLKQALQDVAQLVDSCPDWVSVSFSNAGLGIWHGGGTVIEAVEGCQVPAIQLRRALQRKRRYLGLYSRDEFLRHELVHVGRVVFDEPQFEELLAYQVSSNWFRRWLGPIIHSGKEVWLFIIALIIPIAVDYIMLAMSWVTKAEWALLLYLLPLACITFAMWRLMRNHRAFKRCRANLAAIVGDTHKALWIAYRLTDREIYCFARWNPAKIKTYSAEQTSLRWQVIQAAYGI